jgi:hypothetical protein
VAFVVGVVVGDLKPEGGGMVHVVDVGELVEDDVVAEGFRQVHETDIERDGARVATAAPTGVGVRKAQVDVFVVVLFGPKVEAIREVLFGFSLKDFFLGVAGTLGGGVFEREFFADLFPAGV